MRVAVTYDAGAETGAPDAAGVLEAVRAVIESLGRLGHSAFPVAVRRPYDRLLTRLETVDRIVNLTEGLEARGEGEARAAALQELSGRPVTGASAETLALCRRKDRVNALLSAAGLPVPEWAHVPPGIMPSDWGRFPAIVKPLDEDGSIGIGDDAVADDPWQLRLRLERASSPMLVQRFLPGRELNVGLVGDRVLPVSEILFTAPQRVVSYGAKWTPGSPGWEATPVSCPARLDAPLHARVVELAREAWEVVGGRGYGRIDLRTDEADVPYILEVNPNPDLAPDAGLARMAEAAGWGYDGLVSRVLEVAT